MLKRIEADLKTAMKSGDKPRVSTIRLLLSALKNEKIQAHRDLTDEEVEAVIRRGAKQRKDSIEQYGRGGRSDLVEIETAELRILEAYLPQGLTDADLENAVKTIISDRSLTSKKEVGAVMKELMVRYKGRVDGRKAQEIAQRLLP
ncbi:MAG: GatB/YqeY domain-containing protein [Thermoanaerobaculia bacterium]